MFTVTISEKGGQQSQYEFNKPEITIGRMKGNDIVLPKGNVSKKHSQILVRDGAIHIADLNSTNGTYVNGRKVTSEQALTENDKIYIGDFILQVEREQDVASAPPAAPPSPPRGTGGGAPSGGIPSGSGGMGNSQGMPAGGGMGRDAAAAAAPSPPSPPAGDVGRAASPAGDLFAPGDSPAAAEPSAPPSRQRNGSSSGAKPSPGNRGSSPTGRGPSGGASLGAGPSSPPARGAADRGQPEPPRRGQRDRDREPLARSGGYPQGSAMVASEELDSEFDQQFHAAQYDVARVLFETLPPEELPLEYPPMPEDKARFDQEVSQAVGKVNPMVDREALTEVITAEAVGLGPLETYLDDPDVRDIYVNRFDKILIRRAGRTVIAERAFSHPVFLQVAAERLLGSRGEAIGADEVRFSDGTRVHIVMPPLSVDGPALTIRKPPARHLSLDELVGEDVMSPGMVEFLRRAVQAGRSILIGGPTSSGKSTLLGALGRSMAAGTRVIAVEESSHLEFDQDGVVRLEANPAAGYDMTYLVRAAVAMHPQRIVLDECRGGEAYEWVTSAASGTEGSITTIHGTSAADALGRLESLCLLGSPDVSPRGLREQIARAVDLVVIVNRTTDSHFRVRQITEVQGVDLDAFRLNDIFYYRVEGTEGQFHPTGYIPLFYEDLRHAGVDVDFDIFRE